MSKKNHESFFVRKDEKKKNLKKWMKYETRRIAIDRDPELREPTNWDFSILANPIARLYNFLFFSENMMN